MKRIYLVLAFLVLTYKIDFAQSDIFDKSTKFTTGIGYDLNPPSYGLNLTSFYKIFNFGFTYYMPENSNDKVIKEIKNGFIIKAGIVPLFLSNGKYVFPIYIGVGYSLINEKDKVLNYSGDGTIKGFHYFIGLESLSDKSDFLRSLGFHLEIGYSSWNYDDSILKKNNSGIEYNYSKFFFSAGLNYYFL